MNTTLPWISTVFLVVSLFSCQLPDQASQVVRIQLAPPTRTIAADWTAQADSYVVTLTSPDGLKSYTVSAASPGVVEFRGVPAGPWNVAATALGAGLPVAAASHNGLAVSEQGGAALSLTLTADRLGEGGYAFTLRIPSAGGVTSVQGQLFDVSDNPVGDPQSPLLTVDGAVQVTTFEGAGLPGGIYRLAVTVKRGTAVIGRFSEAVNIWTNVTTNQWLAPDGTLSAARTLSLADLADNNTKLANLVMTGDYPLSPGFSSSVPNYYVSAPAGTTFSLTPTQSQSGQMIELQVDSESWTALASGTASAVLTAADGQTLRLRVTAADRTTVDTYVITLSAADVYYRNTLADGGVQPTDSTNYNTGDWVTIQGNPGGLTRAGYQFAGWNTSADGLGTTLIEGAGYQMTSAGVALYPIWIENKFSFTNYLDPNNVNNKSNYLMLTDYTGDVGGNLTIPNGVTSLGMYFISNNSTITSLTLPTTVAAINQNAFFHCPNLSSITFSSSPISLGLMAFWDCGFTTITIPATVVSMGSMPIHAETLTAYTVDAANPNYTSIGGSLYNKAGTSLIAVPGATTGTYTVHPGTTAIEFFAFAWSSVAEAVLPDTVTTLSPYAFHDAREMTAITVDPANTSFSSNGGLLLNKLGTILLSVPYGFEGPLTIPDGVAKVEDDAASSRQKVTSLVFPASLTHIGQNGFSNANGLTALTIPATVVTIESYAFASCYGLTSVTFDGSSALGSGTFQNSYQLKTVVLNSSTPPPLAPYSSGSFFQACHNDLVIKVPASGVDAYKAAPGWSTYAAKIVALP